jgi:hypothetical protein
MTTATVSTDTKSRFMNATSSCSEAGANGGFAFEGWGVLELFGYRRLGGHVSEPELAGQAFVHRSSCTRLGTGGGLSGSPPPELAGVGEPASAQAAEQGNRGPVEGRRAPAARRAHERGSRAAEVAGRPLQADPRDARRAVAYACSCSEAISPLRLMERTSRAGSRSVVRGGPPRPPPGRSCLRSTCPSLRLRTRLPLLPPPVHWKRSLSGARYPLASLPDGPSPPGRPAVFSGSYTIIQILNPWGCFL